MFRALALLGSLALSALAQTGNFDFRVVTTGNAPVTGASVTLQGPDGQAYAGTTESDGHWRLANLAPGAYRFTAFDAPGYVRSPLNFLEDTSIHQGQTREFQFELNPAPKVQGTLFDAGGKPVAGATLFAYTPRRYELSGTATTNAQGVYSITLNASPDSFLSKSGLPMLVLSGIIRQSRDLPVERKSGETGVVIEFELPRLPLAPNESLDLHLRQETASIR